MSRIRRTPEEWLSLIEDCKASDLTVKEFCQQKGICASNYYYWVKRFGSHEGDFVPLTITGKSFPIQVDRGYELVYPNGVTLRLGQSVSLSVLAQLLRL